MAFSVPVGQAFGFLCGSPAAIGLVMADRAMKAADVEIVKYMTPSIGTSHSNEVDPGSDRRCLSGKGGCTDGQTGGAGAAESRWEVIRSIPGTPFLE